MPKPWLRGLTEMFDHEDNVYDYVWPCPATGKKGPAQKGLLKMFKVCSKWGKDAS